MGIDYLVSDYQVASDEKIEKRLRSGALNSFMNGLPSIHLGIFDLDECLVNIGIKWITLMRDRKIIPPISDEEVVKKAIQRDEYYYYKSFGLDKECYEVYRDNPTFYDDLKPTLLGQTVNFMVKCKKMQAVILTHCVGGEVIHSKKRFIDKYFPDIKTFYIMNKEPKSSIINKNRLNSYVTFCDDNIDNLMDIAKNTMSFGKEFYVPRFGYNGEDKFKPEDLQYLADNGISLVYYRNVV